MKKLKKYNNLRNEKQHHYFTIIKYVSFYTKMILKHNQLNNLKFNFKVLGKHIIATDNYKIINTFLPINIKHSYAT